MKQVNRMSTLLKRGLSLRMKIPMFLVLLISGLPALAGAEHLKMFSAEFNSAEYTRVC